MLVQTNRLYLRPVISSDLNDLFKIYGDPATNTFNPAGPYPNIDNAKMVMNRWLDHWQTHSFGNWAISPLTNPEKIIGFGGLGIRNYDDIVINNLGYRLSTEAWGKGLATEFAIYAIKFGFDVIKLTEMLQLPGCYQNPSSQHRSLAQRNQNIFPRLSARWTFHLAMPKSRNWKLAICRTPLTGSFPRFRIRRLPSRHLQRSRTINTLPWPGVAGSPRPLIPGH